MGDRMMADGYTVPDLTHTLQDLFSASRSLPEFRLECAARGIDLANPYVKSTMVASFPNMLSSLYNGRDDLDGRDLYCGRIAELLGSEWAMLDRCDPAEMGEVLKMVAGVDLCGCCRLTTGRLDDFRRHMNALLDEMRKHAAEGD